MQAFYTSFMSHYDFTIYNIVNVYHNLQFYILKYELQDKCKVTFKC